MNVESILKIVKQDLMITSDIRDEYLKTIIQSCERELAGRGVEILDEVEDTLLLADYVAWRYRHREGGMNMPEHLRLRIANKKLKGRLKNE